VVESEICNTTQWLLRLRMYEGGALDFVLIGLS